MLRLEVHKESRRIASIFDGLGALAVNVKLIIDHQLELTLTSWMHILCVTASGSNPFYGIFPYIVSWHFLDLDAISEWSKWLAETPTDKKRGLYVCLRPARIEIFEISNAKTRYQSALLRLSHCNHTTSSSCSTT